MLKRGAVAAINHLLAQQPALRARLAPFAGQCVEFRLDPLPSLRLTILESGDVARTIPEPSAEQSAAQRAARPGDLVVTIRRAALPLLLRRNEAALREIEVAGDTALAEAVQFLLLRLEWDPEEDLSRLVGDVLAHRIAGAGRDFVAWQRDAGYRLAQNFAEYWTEEHPILARSVDLAAFSDEVNALSEALVRVERRLDALSNSAPAAPPPDH